MTPRQIIILILRVLAIVGFFYFLQHIGEYIEWYHSPDLPISKSFLIFLSISQLLLCFVFWVFPTKVAKFILPSALKESLPSPSSIQQWQAVAFISIGLFMLMQAIPDTFYWAAVMNMKSASGHVSWADLSPVQHAQFLATSIQLGLGLVVFFGAKGLSAIMWKLRAVGNVK